MKVTTITDAKNRLSAVIDWVKGGDTVMILDRGTAVARLEPIIRRGDQSGRIERLERSGTLLRGRTTPPVDLIRSPAPRTRRGASALAALIDERRTGR
jgi:antitoxin (DNA-binding transcriptional repressor) of toxin-antitoxin stability system